MEVSGIKNKIDISVLQKRLLTSSPSIPGRALGIFCMLFWKNHIMIVTSTSNCNFSQGMGLHLPLCCKVNQFWRESVWWKSRGFLVHNALKKLKGLTN